MKTQDFLRLYGVRVLIPSFLILLSFLLMVYPTIKGFSTGGLHLISLAGCLLLIYSLLSFSKTARYAIILALAFFLLFLLLIFVGIGVLVSLNLRGRMAEDIAFSIGFLCVIGFFVSMVSYLIRR